MTNYLKSLATWLLFFFATAASAQETSVSGTVLENTKNQPLEGVTVKVAGTNKLTKTGANGGYSITVKQGDVLEFSYVGFASQRITYRGQPISITLKSTGATELDEVVVAMDIKRELDELEFSTQKVEGQQIQQNQRENFLNSLLAL